MNGAIVPVRREDESGVTLIELLIVLVIIPIILGSIAFTITSVYDNSSTAQSRLGDSVNTQSTAAYFPRDVEAAQYVTTSSSASTIYATAISSGNAYSGLAETVPVCGSTSPSNSKLLVGLFRPATFSSGGSQPSSGASIAYWVQSFSTLGVTHYQLVRYSCSVSISGSIAAPTWTVSATSATTTSISDDINYLTQQIAYIPDTTQAALAASGWTSVNAVTVLTSSVSLVTDSTKGVDLPVVSTAGFSTGTTFIIFLNTSAGTQSVTCAPTTGDPDTAQQFSNCYISSGGTAASAGAGYVVAQPTSISDVKLAVSEPGTDYGYSLEGAPRSFSNAEFGSASPQGPQAPPLLFLGGSSTFPAFVDGASGKDGILGSGAVAVNGVIGLNGDTVNCQKSTGLTTDGYENIAGGGSVTGCANTTETTGSTITDPISPFLPLNGAWNAYPDNSATAPYFNQLTKNPAPVSGVCQPGEYTTDTGFNSCSSLAAGVYVLDGGKTTTVNTLSYAGPSGSGILFYLPCTNSTCSAQPSFSAKFSGQLPGLSAAQSASYFGTTALQNLAFWQNAVDTSPLTLWGSNSISSPTGIVYAPSAQLVTGGTGCLEAAELIVNQVAITGGGGASACGTYNLNIVG